MSWNYLQRLCFIALTGLVSLASANDNTSSNLGVGNIVNVIQQNLVDLSLNNEQDQEYLNGLHELYQLNESPYHLTASNDERAKALASKEFSLTSDYLLPDTKALDIKQYIELVNKSLDYVGSPLRLPTTYTKSYNAKKHLTEYVTKLGNLVRFVFSAGIDNKIIEVKSFIDLELIYKEFKTPEASEFYELVAIVTAFISPDGTRKKSITNINNLMRQTFATYKVGNGQDVTNGNLLDSIRYNVDIRNHCVCIMATPNPLYNKRNNIVNFSSFRNKSTKPNNSNN